MDIYDSNYRKERIAQLLDDWNNEHDCPEVCNGNANIVCDVCVGWEGECKEEMLDDYRERLERMTPEELEKELDSPDW